MKKNLLLMILLSSMSLISSAEDKNEPVIHEIPIEDIKTCSHENSIKTGSVYDYFGSLLDTSSFPARWNCGTWTEFEGWFYILSDLTIWFAYFTIPAILFYFFRKKRTEFGQFNGILLLFIGFILFCGLTHLIDAIIFWWPAYRLSGLVRFVTAVISLSTAVALVKFTPLTLEFKSPMELEKIIRKRTKELEKANKNLERSNESLEQFAYVASHDLQAPLRTAIAFSEQLKKINEGKLDEKSEEYLELISGACTRMSDLVKDLLAFSKIDQPDDIKTSINISAMLTMIQNDLKVSLEETNAKITTENLPETLFGSKSQIRQVFSNIIANAIKFRKTDEDPEIKIEGIEGPAHWNFHISDNGIGIDPEYQEKIFVIFERLHSQSKYPGTGIGLAICQKIIERHGGEISVKSALGVGSTFSFSVTKKG